ncbi:MAG TPA: acyltransferase [Terriglobales bacterium]|nr:acyltransferase [Terriglobales bacterium]
MPNIQADMDLSIREVAATFGRREIRQDPLWERDLAAWLRTTNDRDQLHTLFGRFRMGESAFDAFMRRVLLHALCRSVGHDLQVGIGVVLKHPETMEFGDSVFIGSQVMIQGRFDGTCKIGNHVWIGPQAYLDARQLTLEDYVGWGPGAKVLGSVHTGDPIDQPIITTGLLIKPVVVETGADVGMNASILPGVRIGSHAIVGAGAVVTTDVPEYAIVAGVPARMLRSRRSE